MDRTDEEFAARGRRGLAFTAGNGGSRFGEDFAGLEFARDFVYIRRLGDLGLGNVSAIFKM